MFALPFYQLDQDQVTGPAETNPLPLASPPSLWFDYQLKIHNVTLILVKAQRRGEEQSWWKCLERGNDDGWRTNLSSLFMGSVIVWQRLLCSSLSLSFMNLQVAGRLQEFSGCQIKSCWRHSTWVQMGVFFYCRQGKWLQVWKYTINSVEGSSFYF